MTFSNAVAVTHTKTDSSSKKDPIKKAEKDDGLVPVENRKLTLSPQKPKPEPKGRWIVSPLRSCCLLSSPTFKLVSRTGEEEGERDGKTLMVI